MSEITPSTIIYTFTDEAPALATVFAAADRRGVRRCRRHRRGNPRHLARRADPRQLPREPDARTARRRCADRARRARTHAGGKHHQAPQRQCLGAADEGGDRRTPGRGLRHPCLSRRALDARGDRDQAALRQGDGFGRQPGAAPGQLRPASPQGREGLRQVAPPLDGCVVERLEDPRRDDGRPRLPLE